MYNLYEYKVPEEIYNAHSNELVGDLSNPDIEGIYETQVPLEFRALLDLGCLCIVDKAKARQLAASAADTGNKGWWKSNFLTKITSILILF